MKPEIRSTEEEPAQLIRIMMSPFRRLHEICQAVNQATLICQPGTKLWSSGILGLAKCMTRGQQKPDSGFGQLNIETRETH